jgi:3-hydroxyisobutyrate dehydrogenase-like beta-hydroxyacid dehydrogenase
MNVGVVGLGTMGAGIAQLCVEAGLDTVGRGRWSRSTSGCCG